LSNNYCYSTGYLLAFSITHTRARTHWSDNQFARFKQYV